MQKKIFSIYIPGTDFSNYQSNPIHGQTDCAVIRAGVRHECQVVDQYIYTAFGTSLFFPLSLLYTFGFAHKQQTPTESFRTFFGVPVTLKCKL
jgi:hypothetical protein